MYLGRDTLQFFFLFYFSSQFESLFGSNDGYKIVDHSGRSNYPLLGIWVSVAPVFAPKYFPKARAAIDTKVYRRAVPLDLQNACFIWIIIKKE